MYDWGDHVLVEFDIGKGQNFPCMCAVGVSVKDVFPLWSVMA